MICARTDLNICIWTFDQHSFTGGGSWECCHQWWVEFIIFIFLDELWQLSCHLIIKSCFDLQSDDQCWRQKFWIFIKVIVLGLIGNSLSLVVLCKRFWKISFKNCHNVLGFYNIWNFLLVNLFLLLHFYPWQRQVSLPRVLLVQKLHLFLYSHAARNIITIKTFHFQAFTGGSKIILSLKCP